MPDEKDEDWPDPFLEPHFTIHKQANFLEEDFRLSLTERSKELFKMGGPGQGYIGLVDLETGFIHLLPSFNKDDGLLRVDKNGHSFGTEFIESRGGLGQLGDLHTQASRLLNLEEHGGSRRLMMGFGIWKEGAGIKFLHKIPERLGLIPNEYLLVKTLKGYELYYVDENKEVFELDLSQYPNLSDLNCIKNNLPLADISPQERQLIESDRRGKDAYFFSFRHRHLC